MIVEGNDILLRYTQHLQYIFINLQQIYFQGAFIIFIKVTSTHFYRKQ
jgi:hypothetical protein